jgi:gluconate 5-dehydrogenase
MNLDLTGKVATTESRGRADFRAGACRAGADLAITSRTLDAETLPENRRMDGVQPLELDVRDEKSIRRMVSVTANAYGRIDILVNNAGCNQKTGSSDVGRLEPDLDTNLRGRSSRSPLRGNDPARLRPIINIGR